MLAFQSTKPFLGGFSERVVLCAGASIPLKRNVYICKHVASFKRETILKEGGSETPQH